MAPSNYLRPLLAPASVALVGASERPGSPGRVVYENMLAGEFKGELYAVNPAHAKVLGRRAYASLAAIGRPVDLAVICAPPATVPAILKCERGRLRAAAILSGAPMAAPADYRRWRRELAANARASGVRILGPASFGVIRTSQGLNATLGAVPALPGRLTLLSQSGAMVGALLDFARSAGIGFASVAALGAASDVDISELLEFALADDETEGIVLYIETVPDGRRFMSALRAAARTKPVVVLKSGRHGAAAAPGAPSPDRVFDAALKRAGTVRVATYTQLFGAARILALERFSHGNRLAVVTNGRGPGLLAADRAAELGVALPSFAQATVAVLRALSPSRSKPANPFDAQAEAPPERIAAALRVALADPTVDAVVVLHVTTPMAAPLETARAVAAEAQGATKPVLAAWLGAVDRSEASAALEGAGIANFYTPENAVEAFSFLAAYRKNQEWLLEVPRSQAESFAADLAAAQRIRMQARSAGNPLPAGLARALLSAFGIKVLRLTAAGARRRAAPMMRSIGLAGAVEVQIGVHRDAVFGSVIALGLAKSRGQPEVMLPPLNRRLAADLVASVCGVMPAPERDALIALLLKVSMLVCALPWVVGLELGVVAAAGDAVVGGACVVADPKRHTLARGYRHMAIHPYPVELETTVTLRDGSRLRVRPIRPEDAAAERAFVAGLSDESRFFRFMYHLRELTPGMLARFTQVDYDRDLALVALGGKPGAEKIVGVARYAANPDRESAEFAVVVADAWQGRGLGSALMHELIASAKRRGFRRLVGAILGINASMQKLVRTLGFRLRTDADDPEQLIAELDLAHPRRRASVP
ncbi:MAG: GNAT family N-acetyltransferase [Pseudomonadota bacterium]|nr:GNAT family N-acetyltransferase [Pseudomonadota bacterium]